MPDLSKEMFALMRQWEKEVIWRWSEIHTVSISTVCAQVRSPCKQVHGLL